MTRAERRLKYPEPTKLLPETKHLFIGGWWNFDMDYFTRKSPKKIDKRLKENRNE
jgi:hypothetical protein